MVLLGINRIAPICIARQADSDVERIAFDITPWREMYPMLKKYRLEVTSPDGVVYLPQYELSYERLTWVITGSDTAVVGSGLYQIVAVGDNGERKTSAYAVFTVNETMPGTAGDTPPDPAKPWVDKVLAATEAAEQAVRYTEQALTEDQQEQACKNLGLSEENLISIMNEVGMLPTLVDADGAVITDRDDGIILI